MPYGNMEKVDRILESYGDDQSHIITILQKIQSEYRYLPMDVLEYVSDKMEISPAKLFGIATFYENFSLDPKGKYIIKICDGTACHVKKSIPVLEALRKELSLTENKHTTDDLLFTIETVSCLGACGLAPVITINDKVYGKISPEMAVEIIRKLKEEETNANS
ncbi:MAG: NAD(P)H-dependent oxidoreductase subunit E [Tissierellia bacterium]|nr:NAD(P)H-dependent oxidoreductase subunit E [Tissierellia bacterium]